MLSYSDWQRAVDTSVRETLDLPAQAFGFWAYGEPSVANEHELPAHPDGPPCRAWEEGSQPAQYAHVLVANLLTNGYCY